MKRLFSFLLCLGMLACFCACDADTPNKPTETTTIEESPDNPPETTTIEESPAEDFTYEMHNGEVTITGYTGIDRKIRIPSNINDRPVTTIGEAAFANYDMTYIYIPETVKAIERGAFYECVCLEELVFTNGLESIGEDAFAHCEALEECQLPRTLALIEEFAFAYCSSLKTIHIPENLKMIPSYAFSDCTALVKIDFTKGLVRICNDAFSGCTSLAEVILPESLQFIEAEAFSDCDSLTKLAIPQNTHLDININETKIDAYGIDCILYGFSSPVGYQSWYGGNLIGVAPEHPTEPTPFTTILIVFKDSFAHTQLISFEKYGCLQFEVH